MALTHPSYTVDTTFTAKNIASAASVYTFTAAASAKVQFIVKLTNAAGSGDYIIYLTHGWLGAASPATVLPKTTATAAAGETIIEFPSIEMNVKNTDVINVMIDGLAGDTSVNGAIRIVADNPSVFDPAADAVVNVTTVGSVTNPVTAGTVSDKTGYALTVTPPTALQNADAVWDELLAGHVIAGSAGAGLSAAGSGSGSGAITTTLTVNDGTNPLDGVEVWISTDAAGSNVVASGSTNALGQVTFMLDAGAYYVWKQISGYVFTNPETLTVAP